MGSEGDPSAEEGGEKLLLRGEGGGRTPGNKASDRNADEGVKSVPDKIECGDLICEELNAEECDAGADNPPAGEEMKRIRKDKDAVVGKDAEGGDGGVDVETGGEGNRDDESNEFL